MSQVVMKATAMSERLVAVGTSVQTFSIMCSMHGLYVCPEAVWTAVGLATCITGEMCTGRLVSGWCCCSLPGWGCWCWMVFLVGSLLVFSYVRSHSSHCGVCRVAPNTMTEQDKLWMMDVGVFLESSNRIDWPVISWTLPVLLLWHSCGW